MCEGREEGGQLALTGKGGIVVENLNVLEVHDGHGVLTLLAGYAVR